MIRSEGLDCLTPLRLSILSLLLDRELSLGEIHNCLQKGRNAVYYNLRILLSFGLVEQKKALKKNTWTKAKSSHRQIFRFTLTSKGKEALQYFKMLRGEAE